MKIFLDKRCIINLCFLFLYLSSAFATATIVGKHRRLLIINSYNESAPWSQELITPILLQTSPIEDITADVVHMNGTFIRNDSLYIRMENGIFERFQDKKPDYLVLLGNMAFTLRERILSEWGNIPIVLIGNEDTYAPREYYFTGRPIHISNAITSPLVDLQPQYNFTFIETPYMYKETIDMMVQMLPKMKTIVFAADELYHNQDLDRLIHAYITSKYPNLHYERLIGNERNQNELQAYLLNDEKMKGRGLYRTMYFVPVVTTASVVGIIMIFILGVQGPVNHLLVTLHILQNPVNFLGNAKYALPTLVIISLWKDCGTYMIYWLAGLQGVSKDVYEAATIDGANFHIVLPLIAPTGGIIAILCAINSLKVFDIVKTMTEGGPYYATDVIATYVYRTAFSSEIGMPRLGYASAAALFFGGAVIIIGILLNAMKDRLQKNVQ